jgi:N-acetylglucosamine kinase-like BadF-type ATPase
VETCLLREIQNKWQLEDLASLVAKANLRERPDFAALANIVANCADEGDVLAQSVLDRAGEELAAQVSLVISKMRTADCAEADGQRVAFTGSVLSKIPRVLRAMEEHLHTTWPEISVDATAVQPLEGALWRARRGR